MRSETGPRDRSTSACGPAEGQDKTDLVDQLAIHARDPPDILHHRLELGEPALQLDVLAPLEKRDGHADRLLDGFERGGQVQRGEAAVR